jgi:hypothetical protein
MSLEQDQSEARSRTAGNSHLGTGAGDIRRRAGWVAAASAVIWFTTLVIEHRYGLFPDQRTGPAVIATQLLFFGGMLGWAAALVILLRGRAVRGRFAKFALGLQCAGLLGLVAAGLLTLNSGNQDSAVFPVAGLAMILGGILTGIALFVGRALPGRVRWVGLAYSGLVLAFLLGGTPPTPASESMLPLAWLVLGVALLATSGQRNQV